MLFVIGVILLSVLVPSHGALNEILDRCCTMGARLAEGGEGCNNFNTVPLGDVDQSDHMSCRSIIQVCCLKQKHIAQCQVGKEDSMKGKTCSPSSGSEYTECCQCCKLGQVAKAANLPCDLTSIGGPCDQVFKECCMAESTGQPVTNPDNIDECALYGEQLCDQECVNTVGSYKCACRPGFVLNSDGRTCQLASKGSLCSTSNNPCQHNCAEVNNKVKCSCYDGFRLSTRDQRTCVDIDECSGSTSPCPLGQYCVNTDGSYKCQRGKDGKCPSGFTFNPRTQRCEINVPQCPAGQSYNTISRRCETSTNQQCSTGFAYNVANGQCQDINECAQSYDLCVGEQRCENTEGSYVCRRIKGCGTGYTLDERTQGCVDVDECAIGTHNCGVGYDCRNVGGNFRCEAKKCPKGYRVSFSTGQCEIIVCAPGHRTDREGNCVDINECVENPQICGSRTKRCINNIGSYTCQNLVNCPAGYELQAGSSRCKDIDECSRGTHTCKATQECQNRPGTFVCQCPDGYESVGGIGGRCEDIDECQRYATQVCASNSDCLNTQGSFTCVCKAGFHLGADGKTCTDKDECQDQYRCEQECINTYGSYHCLCNDGYKLAADKRRCEDIDECNFYSGRGRLCIGKCTNIPGSYTCSCPTGYRMMGDQRTCQDIDECAEGTSRCPSTAVCTNTRGSFKCQDIACPRGFYRASSYNNREKSVRCQRKSFVCAQGDQECLSNTLLSYSYNFLTFPTKIRIPADLFTMSGPQTEFRRMEFNLKLLSARELLASVARATRDMFELRKLTNNKAVVRLLREIPGPQDVELELEMHIYGSDNTFFGTAKAKIFLYVTGIDVS